uniref:Uncharacterized protein n=1 Tax=Glossina pallidipes TaxID=7398 RepID=A0A1B0A966_GLOPL
MEENSAIASTTPLATSTATIDNNVLEQQQQIAPTPTRKRATSFIRKKPPLERADGPTPEVIVTKPSPEQTIISLGLRPDNSTLVHVLVHRESEEYKEEDEDNERDIASPASNGMEKPKPPQIRISPGASDIHLADFTADKQPIVQIMVESPKEPPRGDFSAVCEETPIPITEPIDVNVQGDTSKVFYDYHPDDINEIVVLETLTEESPKLDDHALPALPDIPSSTTDIDNDNDNDSDNDSDNNDDNGDHLTKSFQQDFS